MKFDTQKRDAQGRPLGWALALMEMVIDPMLLAWVPGWVVEQYERWNPYFRPCLRSALRQYKMKSGTVVLDESTKARVENPHAAVHQQAVAVDLAPAHDSSLQEA